MFHPVRLTISALALLLLETVISTVVQVVSFSLWMPDHTVFNVSCEC